MTNTRDEPHHRRRQAAAALGFPAQPRLDRRDPGRLRLRVRLLRHPGALAVRPERRTVGAEHAIDASINGARGPGHRPAVHLGAATRRHRLWRVVTATGQFDPSRQVQVRLRQDANGKPVSEVIAAVPADHGETLLVDRGYVSFADVRSGVADRAAADRPGHHQRPSAGRADRPEEPASHWRSATTSRPTPSPRALDRCGRPTRPSSCRATSSSPRQPGVLTPIDLPQTDDGPFLSYALQWEAFGVIALIGMGVFIFREAAEPRPPDDHVDAGRRRRRGAAPVTGADGRRRSAGRGTGSTSPSCMTSELPRTGGPRWIGTGARLGGPGGAGRAGRPGPACAAGLGHARHRAGGDQLAAVPPHRLFLGWNYWWQAHLLDCLTDAQLRDPRPDRPRIDQPAGAQHPAAECRPLDQ